MALLIAGVCGCSGKSDAPGGPAQGPSRNSSAPTANPSSNAGNTPAPPSSAKDLARTDETGRKWLGDIPYDVWFDDPLAVAGDLTDAPPPGDSPGTSGSSEPDATASSAKSPEKEPAKVDGAAPRTVAATDWEKVVASSVLEAEAKLIRNSLTQALQTVGTYNGNYKTIPVEGSTLAAVAGIVIEHPGTIAWKDRAPWVRDLAARIAEAANGLGKKPFDATTLIYEQLVIVLDGGKPANLAPAEPTVPFADRAERGGLMQRMNRSYTWLKQNVGNEIDFAAKSADADHEAALLAALGTVVSHPGYGSADEADYQKHAAGLIEASRQMQEAIKSTNFQGFQDSLNQVQQRCDQCHKKYRLGDEF
ncbi:MAG: cytochrome c [Planctomycetaceae bacterium]